MHRQAPPPRAARPLRFPVAPAAPAASGSGSPLSALCAAFLGRSGAWARRLAGLHRAGELTPVAIPTPAQEAVRDLRRTRGDMVQDLTRARNRLSGFLLRHSVVWRGGSPWTERHRRWLATLSFDDLAIATTYSHYLATVKLRDTALESVEADLVPWCTKDPFGDQVPRLAAYRGVSRIGALCLAAEVFDWRRFPRARP